MIHFLAVLVGISWAILSLIALAMIVIGVASRNQRSD